jgi:2-C-methyl-D-erythritol 4-phosphate cytidylyltransferase/2-C-methyl-D-erythritol 2,4-cyclodiphosphate synthase
MKNKQHTAVSQIGIIIPAAGFGTRMGANQPKQFLELVHRPILIHTIAAFLEHKSLPCIAVALPDSHFETAKNDILSFFAQRKEDRLLFTRGGKTRQQSVYNGLQTLPKNIQYILVHDGARPLISSPVIDRCIQGIIDNGAVIAAVPVKDTLKKVDSAIITDTVNRDNLWQAQTPQAMRRDLLEQAYRHAQATGFAGTDEASLLEHASIPVGVVEGSEHNIKITRPGDLTIAAGLLQIKSTTMKIGHGFDAHQLAENRKLILGGVEIPHSMGLDGHSDADVVTHALIDAILGALGKGDIGRLFPDTDDSYKGINSLKLLSQVITLVKDNNLQMGNADITIICQQPKLANHLTRMQTNLARTCNTLPENINIKATTTEKMGFTGRSEGISTHAVVLLRQSARGCAE